MMQNVLQLRFKCRQEYNYAVRCRRLERNTQCISDKNFVFKRKWFYYIPIHPTLHSIFRRLSIFIK